MTDFIKELKMLKLFFPDVYSAPSQTSDGEFFEKKNMYN